MLTSFLAGAATGAILKGASKKKTAKKKAVKKTCTNRVKCSGLTSSGKLKKGYRFGKDGKVIKAQTAGTKRKK